MPWFERVGASLAWLDPYLAPWFSAWGVPVSQLEGAAFVLSLLMVTFNLRVNPLGWPLAILSSVLYGLLFMRSRLYGEAALQVVFIGVSVWGWRLWLRGGPKQLDEPVSCMKARARWWSLLVVLLAWPALGYLLHRITDSDVPYADALPTAGSLLGQWLLARKRVENWPCWLLVNLVSMGLFAYKQLWLTVWLYGLFALLSVWGWRMWAQLAQAQPELPPGNRP
jgi:nicotinamide mononucleotide transporter